MSLDYIPDILHRLDVLEAKMDDVRLKAAMQEQLVKSLIEESKEARDDRKAMRRLLIGAIGTILATWLATNLHIISVVGH